MTELIPGLSVERFSVWTCKTCQSELRWITLHDRSGGRHRIETISVYADPDSTGDVIHEGDGNGRRATGPADSLSELESTYRQHGPMCDGARCPREFDPAPAPTQRVAMTTPEPNTVLPLEPRPPVMFDAPIPDDFLFAGPPAPIPAPAPTGLHAEPQGVEAQRAATAEAIDRVEANAPVDWRAEADAAIRSVASRFEAFTADDVWDTGLTIPPTPSALGPVFRAAQKAGIIAPTEQAVESRYAHRHRKLKVWRSLLTAPAHALSPAGFEVTSCDSCSAPITWTVTANGAKMPVDAMGDPAGNLLVSPDDDPNGVPIATVASRDLKRWPGVTSIDVLRTVSHFSTCPQRDQWRRR